MKNKVRVFLQALIIGLLGYVATRPLYDGAYLADFEAYCPFGGISSLMSKFHQGTMSCQMGSVQLMLGIGLIIGVILVGKLFCSHLCPIGSVSEWLGKIGDKLKMRFDLPEWLDRPMRSLKYVLLFITIYFTMTSSELFCKEYDPYFAFVYLFGNTDSVLMYAVPAFIITILGAIFLRLFWCKYLCPLSAASNIFLNIVPVAGVILLYVVLVSAGMEISLVWLVAAVVAIGFITEIFFKRSFLSPLPKITRNDDACTHCGLCDKKCPQGIEISKYEKVTHIDCNLCTDCVYHCGGRNALSVGNKKGFKYLAPIMTVVLIALSLGAATQFEFTTIAERWNNFEQLEQMQAYEHSGLKNVKCYGSAMSLKNKIEPVKGIYGMDAWASSNSIKIYYNPAEITEQGVKKAIFSPTKQKVRLVKNKDIDSLAIYAVGVDELFDSYDNLYLTYAFRDIPGVYGFETEFGEPVLVTVFYNPDSVSTSQINDRINEPTISVKKRDGYEDIDVEFQTADTGEDLGYLTVLEYKKRIFKPYDRMFNKYNSYVEDSLSVLTFDMPDAESGMLRRYFGYLTSHLSNQDAIVRFSTRYYEAPTGMVFFDAKNVDVETIKTLLTADSLTVHYSDGSIKKPENPYNIDPSEGVVKAFSEVDLD